MKIGETWKLKKHYTLTLLKYAKEVKSRALGLIVEIVNIFYDSSGEMVVIIKCKESGMRLKHSRVSFLDAYEKTYEAR